MIGMDVFSILDVPGMATFISLLLGFGVASLFRPLCKGPECVILRGPPVNDIRGSVYQFGSKCIEFDAKAVACPPKDGAKQVVETLTFADLS